MNTTSSRSVVWRSPAVLLVPLALLLGVQPAFADGFRIPNPEINNVGTCWAATATQMEETCNALPTFGGGWPEPRTPGQLELCNHACNACCEFHSGIDDFDRMITGTLCECAQAFLTGGSNAIKDAECAKEAGWQALTFINRLSDLIPAATWDKLSKAKDIIEVRNILKDLPKRYHKRLKRAVELFELEGTPVDEGLEFILAFVASQFELLLTLFEVCDKTEDWANQHLKDACHDSCDNAWKLPDVPPPPPDPPQNPDGPIVTTPGGGDGSPPSRGTEECAFPVGTPCTTSDGRSGAFCEYDPDCICRCGETESGGASFPLLCQLCLQNPPPGGCDAICGIELF